MAEWYVYQHDGDPLGPWSTESVADAILSGHIAPDAWVAAPGGPRWLRALDVPVIGSLVEGIPTVPRRQSGLRIVPAFEADVAAGGKKTVMMILEQDRALMSEAAPSTRRDDPDAEGDEPDAIPEDASRADDEPAVSEVTPTLPALPPSSSSTPTLGERRRRQGGG